MNQSGGTSYPRANSGWALEIALDVETAHGICPACKILLVEASSASMSNLGAAENEAIALGATVVSNSWGGGEYSSETTDDSRYFNHPGVAITVSSGDGGYGVEYPAASRYVTAVGGTTLNLNGTSWASETTWSGAGSGCSSYEPKPAWQTDTGCSRRTVADVSADADPNTGAAVYDGTAYSGQSGWFQVGGTSLAAPLVAAVYALTGTASSVNAGSTPYAHAGSLHDVTSGSNGSCGGSYLCTAKPGYDGPTGLGTPNGLTAFTAGSTQPDFSVGVSPSSATVQAGTDATYTVSVGSSGGFSGNRVAERERPARRCDVVVQPRLGGGVGLVDADRAHGVGCARQLPVHDHGHQRLDEPLDGGDARRAVGPGRRLRNRGLAVVGADLAHLDVDLPGDDHAAERVRRLGVALGVRLRERSQRVVLAEPRHDRARRSR